MRCVYGFPEVFTTQAAPDSFIPKNECFSLADKIAFIAAPIFPPVLFLNPVGIESPDANCLCCGDSTVLAPIAAHEIRSELYCGVKASRYSVADGKPIPALCKRISRERCNPLFMSFKPLRSGS